MPPAPPRQIFASDARPRVNGFTAPLETSTPQPGASLAPSRAGTAATRGLRLHEPLGEGGSGGGGGAMFEVETSFEAMVRDLMLPAAAVRGAAGPAVAAPSSPSVISLPRILAGAPAAIRVDGRIGVSTKKRFA